MASFVQKNNKIFDGEFFTITGQHDDVLNVRCVSCGNDAPLLRSSSKSNGNILKHIQRRHPELLDTIRQKKNIKSRDKSGMRSQAASYSNRLSNQKSASNDANNQTSDSYLDPLKDPPHCSVVSPDESLDYKKFSSAFAPEVQHVQIPSAYRTTVLAVESNELCETENDVNAATETLEEDAIPQLDAYVPNGDCDGTGCVDDTAETDVDCDLLTLEKKLVHRKLEVVEEQHALKMQILQNELNCRRVEHLKMLEYLRRKYD